MYRPGQENWQDSKSSHSNYFGALPRRPSRDSPPVPSPPLTHHDSTLSSESAGSIPSVIPVTTITDGGKGGRTLPQPVGFGTTPRTSALDIRSATASSHSGVTLPPITASSHAPDRRTSNWPALLRATELAREAALQESDPVPDRDDSD